MARYRRGVTHKLNSELIASISRAIRSGVTIEQASLENGISKDTFYRWLASKKGRYSTALVERFQAEIRSAMEESSFKNHNPAV